MIFVDSNQCRMLTHGMCLFIIFLVILTQASSVDMSYMQVEEHTSAILPCKIKDSLDFTWWNKTTKGTLQVEKRLVKNNVNVASDARIKFNEEDHSLHISDVVISDEGVYIAVHKEHPNIFITRCIVDLSVYVTGKMQMTTSSEPHWEGRTFHVRCVVPRVKGNVSHEDLNLYIDHSAIYKPFVTTNDDMTNRLLIDINFHLASSINNTNVTCKYSPSDGDLQVTYYTIYLTKPTNKLGKSEIISISSVGGCLVLISIFVFPIWIYRRVWTGSTVQPIADAEGIVMTELGSSHRHAPEDHNLPRGRDFVRPYAVAVFPDIHEYVNDGSSHVYQNEERLDEEGYLMSLANQQGIGPDN